jgi:Isoprenylcysteine carboxyl methyltransferase (ICMT) family
VGGRSRDRVIFAFHRDQRLAVAGVGGVLVRRGGVCEPDQVRGKRADAVAASDPPLMIGAFLIFHSRNHHVIYGQFYDDRAVEYAGTAITILGLLFSVWARIHLGQYWSGIITLKEGHKLIRSGPYRFVRHPIYTGFITAMTGSAISMATGDANQSQSKEIAERSSKLLSSSTRRRACHMLPQH